ncbi:COG1361 S-layer family protein [Methanocaldococcus sp. 10A]
MRGLKNLLVIFSLLFLLTQTSAYITFENIDYKAQYLEPSKTYDLYVTFESDEEINNTVVYIKPYNQMSKNNIQIIKGEQWIGHLFPSEIGVAHFIIKVSPNAPNYDYKMVVYCNYTKDREQYSENRIFTFPVRGTANIIVEPNNNILKIGTNKVLILLTNKGTGIAENIKITFQNSNNLVILGDNTFTVTSLNPKISAYIPLTIFAKKEGVYSINYKISYKNPYDLLQLTQKSETISGDSKTETLTYQNKNIVENSGSLTFNVFPNELVSININNPIITVGKIENLTISIKNNYKDSLFIVQIGKYFIGNNQKTVFIKKGETKNLTFQIKVDKEGIISIPVVIYFDKNQIEKNLTINIIGKADLVLSGIDVESSFNDVKITGDIDNIGTGKAKSVLISLEKTKNVIPKKPYENYFVGTLNPDDYGSFELHCQINGTVNDIPVTITYRDENNNLITIHKTIKINKEVISLKNENGGEINYIVVGIGVLFCVGVVYLIYRGFVRKDKI